MSGVVADKPLKPRAEGGARESVRAAPIRRRARPRQAVHHPLVRVCGSGLKWACEDGEGAAYGVLDGAAELLPPGRKRLREDIAPADDGEDHGDRQGQPKQAQRKAGDACRTSPSVASPMQAGSAPKAK